MLAIKRINDIKSGKKFSTGGPAPPPSEIVLINRDSNGTETHSYMPGDMRTFHGPPPPPREHPQGVVYSIPPGYNPNGAQFSPSVYRSFHHGTLPPNNSPHHMRQHSVPKTQHSVQYRPDFVPVQVQPPGRRTSKEGLFEEPIYSTFHPDANRYSNHQSNQYCSLPPRPSLPIISSANPNGPPRSLDDGDITPTNEMISSYESGSGTLPRLRGPNNKFRPVAKVTAKTRVEVHQEMSSQDNIMNKSNKKEEKPIAEVPPKPQCDFSRSDNFPLPHSTNNTPQSTPKKLPPPPPRRSNSISESTKAESLNNQTNQNHYGYLKTGGLSYGYMGVKNNIEPDVESDLPPPPPAPHDVGNHRFIHHHPSRRRPQHQLITTNQPEDFPQPPPPLSSNCQQPSADEMKKQPLQSVVSAVSSSVDVTVDSCQTVDSVVMRPRRNDSTVSNCSHKVRLKYTNRQILGYAHNKRVKSRKVIKVI